jgi:hypothetical protein
MESVHPPPNVGSAVFPSPERLRMIRFDPEAGQLSVEAAFNELYFRVVARKAGPPWLSRDRAAPNTGPPSLIETCKLNDVDPLAYLANVLTRIANGHPNSDIDQLLPWSYRQPDL